jgi:hypothetical protein
MKKLIPAVALTLCIVFAGCENKQVKLDKLQADYKAANKQYTDDCIAPAMGAAGASDYLKGTKPKIASPQEEAAHQQKCAQELKQVTALEQQIAAISK